MSKKVPMQIDPEANGQIDFIVREFEAGRSIIINYDRVVNPGHFKDELDRRISQSIAMRS